MKILKKYSKKYSNGGTTSDDTEKVYDKDGNLIVEEKEKEKRKFKRKYYDEHGNLIKEKYKSKKGREKPILISKEKRDDIKEFLKDILKKDKDKDKGKTKDEGKKDKDYLELDCKPGEEDCNLHPGDDKKQDYQDGKIGFDELSKDYPIHSKERKDLYDEFNKRYDETIDGYDKEGNPINGKEDKKWWRRDEERGYLMKKEDKPLEKKRTITREFKPLEKKRTDDDFQRGGILKRFRKKYKHKYEDYRPGKQTYTDKHGKIWEEGKGEGPMVGVHKLKQRGKNVIVQKKKTKGRKRFPGLSSIFKKIESGPEKATKVKYTKRGKKVVEREGLKRKVTKTKYRKAKNFTNIDDKIKSEKSRKSALKYFKQGGGGSKYDANLPDGTYVKRTHDSKYSDFTQYDSNPDENPNAKVINKNMSIYDINDAVHKHYNPEEYAKGGKVDRLEERKRRAAAKPSIKAAKQQLKEDRKWLRKTRLSRLRADDTGLPWEGLKSTKEDVSQAKGWRDTSKEKFKQLKLDEKIRRAKVRKAKRYKNGGVTKTSHLTAAERLLVKRDKKKSREARQSERRRQRAAAGDAFGAEGVRGIFKTGRIKRAKEKIAENRALKEKYSGQRRGGKSFLGAKLTEFFDRQGNIRGKKNDRFRQPDFPRYKRNPKTNR